MSPSQLKMTPAGDRTLEGELEEKLLLHDGAPRAKCSAGGAAKKRCCHPEEVGDVRERFVRAYDRLRDELLSDDSCELTDEAKRWVAQFQASALLLDDIMDNSHTRRDQICWYRRPEVGLRGINDGILLKCHVASLIKKYFREKPYYIDMLELWDEISLQTSLGQMLDLISTCNGANDLAKYNIEGYNCIVKYKTSCYSFYLPVACALLLSGAKLENFSGLRDILIEMGIYFQAQIGTDIEDHKCSWLIVQALGHANNNQIEDTFLEFEDRAYKHLVSPIEAQHDRAVQAILKSFLKKIHRRKR